MSPIDTRLRLVRGTIVGGVLAAFLLAPRLWLAHPFFGPLPVFSWVPTLPPPLDLVVLVVLVALLVPLLVARRPRRWILLWCALFAARSLGDRLTWQPYFFQYFFMLLALAFAGRGDRPDEDEKVLHAERLIVASVYLWSGVSKVDDTFLHGGILAVLEPIASQFPPALVVRLSFLVPGLEIAIALGLLLPRLRNGAVVLAILMHLSLLYVLGPFGQNYNRVVWPWNVVMILLLLLLFWRARRFGAADVLWTRGFAFQRVILALFTLAPGLSYVGLWDPYLSFRLYSYTYLMGTLHLREHVRQALPARTRTEVEASEHRGYAGRLVVPYWSEHELGAFAPPTSAVYRGIARKVCTLAREPADVLLVLDDPPDSLTCDRL